MSSSTWLLPALLGATIGLGLTACRSPGEAGGIVIALWIITVAAGVRGST